MAADQTYRRHSRFAFDSQPGLPVSSGRRLHLPRPVWIVLFLSLAWRIGVAALIGAGFDEAYYYAYSIRPTLSYFDHPPFVGFLAGLFPFLTGIVSAFTIRLGAVLLFTISGLVFYRLAGRFGSERQALYAYILFNLTPMFMVGAGIMILPDSGLLFFWTLALLILSRIFIRGDHAIRNWIMAGVLTGMCMLSKYQGVLLVVCVLIMLLLLNPRRIFRAGTLLYGAAALAIFSPVIVWNIENHFISFLFQGGRAVGGNISPGFFLQALVGQAAYLTPFIFFPLYAVLFHILRKAVKTKDPDCQFFAVFGTVPVLLILFVSLLRQILPHWTFPGYIALMIPLGQWLADSYHRKKFTRFISWAAVVFILVGEAAAVLHTRTGVLPLEKLAQKGRISGEEARLDITLDAFGWEKVGTYITEHYSDKELFLFTHLWFLSGKVDLAVGDQYPVMCFDDKDARGYGIWDAKLDMRGKDGLFICTDRYPLDPFTKYADYFHTISGPDSIVVFRGSRPAKTFYFYYCQRLIKRYPLPYR